jgi:hypothetical protein
MADGQDLHLAERHNPDPGVPHHQPPAPSAARIAASWQLVRIKNTSNQTHIIFDRFYQGIQLDPGQTREVPMLVDEIEALIDMRRPERGKVMLFDPTSATKMRMGEKPPHPLVVEGFENPGPKPDKPATIREPEQQPAQEAAASTETSTETSTRRKLS